MFSELLLIFILFILPVVLIYFKIIPFKYKLYILGVVVLSSLAIVVLEKWGLEKIGLQLETTVEYAIPYFLFTLSLGIALLLISKLQKRGVTPQWWKNSHFLYGFILVSVLQEFVFRGFLIPELQSLFSSTILVILINATLFAFMHIIYSDDTKALVMIFLGGIGFASMYVYFPSLILIAISHTILNFIAVYYGFFNEERK